MSLPFMRHSATGYALLRYRLCVEAEGFATDYAPPCYRLCVGREGFGGFVRIRKTGFATDYALSSERRRCYRLSVPRENVKPPPLLPIMRAARMVAGGGSGCIWPSMDSRLLPFMRSRPV